VATKKTKTEIEAILARVHFLDRRFLLLAKGDGFLLQLAYEEADVERPGSPPVLQKSRKHYVSPWATETEIVETAFLCAERSWLHVLKEHFTYRGRRVYSPHFHVGARLMMCDEGRFDGRERDG
jgi:hypothetical protein